jgi:ATP-dependent protease ClpP protease subunit
MRTMAPCVAPQGGPPQVEDPPGPGQRTDVFQRLLKERIVFIGSAIDQVTANLVCAQLILLEAEDPTRTSPSTSTRRADR